MAPPAARPMVSPSGLYSGALADGAAPGDVGAGAGCGDGRGAGAGAGGGAPAESSMDGDGARAGMAHAETSNITSSTGIKMTENFQKVNDPDFFILYSPFIRFLYKYTDEKQRYYMND